MHAMVRHVLAFSLTLALIVGGVPFAHSMAHAMPDAAPAVAAVQETSAHRHDAAGDGHAMHHGTQQQASADMQSDPEPSAPAKTDDLCTGPKCCSMCATAYVTPLSRDLNADRAFFAVRYGVLVGAHPQGMTFIDPGIPIF